MKLDYVSPIVVERCFASYIVEDESRESIFDITKRMGYIYRGEYSEITPEGKTKTTLELVRQTTLSEYLISVGE